MYLAPIGNEVLGEYFNDNLAVGTVPNPFNTPPLTLKNVTMAVATDTQLQTAGVWGVGFVADESENLLFGDSYPSILDEMVSQGLLSHRGYSLWLDDLGSFHLLSYWNPH